MKITRLALPLIAALAFVVSGCGAIATPEWAADAQSTRVAVAATDTFLTSIAPTATPVPPTATPLPTATPTEPPTATPVPPTPTPEPPTATPEPTEAMPEPMAPLGGESLAVRQPTGDPDAGRVVYNNAYTTAAGVWMCSQCHSITPDEARLIGPGMWNVAIRAETRVEGQDPYTYLEHSIIYPNEYIVPGEPPYPANLMPGNYEEVLTAQELEDLIAYLYTLQ